MKIKKIAMMVTTLALTAALAIGGTLAFLTAQTNTVANTFTVGKVGVTLTEANPVGQTAKMVPGDTIPKDPTVTVTSGSEACWLFLHVDKSANLDSFISYTIADGWNAVEGHTGYYYRSVTAAAADTPFAVLANNQVGVKDTVTEEMMDAVSSNPTLSFTACAVQSAHLDTAAAAFGEVPPAFYTAPAPLAAG